MTTKKPDFGNSTMNMFEALRDNRERLSESERIRSSNLLAAHIAAHPLANVVSNDGPVHRSFWHMPSTAARHFLAPALALILVISSGTGVSIFAERSVPGDLLYAVKTGVNEPVRGALTTDDAALARWSIELANRRLEESAALSLEDRLTSDAQTALSGEFIANVVRATERLGAIAEADPAEAEGLANELENIVTAQDSVLWPGSGYTMSADAPQAFMAASDTALDASAEPAGSARMMKTVAPAPAPEVRARTAAPDIQSRGMGTRSAAFLERQIAFAEEQLANTEDAELREKAAELIARAREELAAGNASLAEDSERSAYRHFASGLESALTARNVLSHVHSPDAHCSGHTPEQEGAKPEKNEKRKRE